MSHLPILVPGRSTPINVPCRLPDSFVFSAFLPARGLRKFCAWLTSTNPLEVEIQDVTLAEPEKDPRHVGGAYDVDEDEATRSDEAAGDVLTSLLARIGISTAADWSRAPYLPEYSSLSAIALAHEAECKAWEALRAAHVALHGAAPFYEANPSKDELAGPQWASKAARMLEACVERVTDEAVAAQQATAEAQQAAWVPPARHHEDINPPAWAETCEGC